jgi:hypothetical protein
MRYIITIIIILFFASVNAQGPVNNEGVKRQVESTVMTKWSKRHFRPKLYYRLVHNRYRRGRDRRLILEIAPNLAVTRLNRERTEQEQEAVNKDFVDEIGRDLDKRINTHYDMLYKDEFRDLFLLLDTNDIRTYLNVLEGYQDNPFKVSDHLFIVETFRERHMVIKDSYQASHLKNTEYDVLIKDMETYLVTLSKIKRRLATFKKYAPIILQIND